MHMLPRALTDDETKLLSQLGSDLQHGHINKNHLQKVLTWLAGLPPERVVLIAHKLPHLAGLYSHHFWKPKRGRLWPWKMFRRHPDDVYILRAYPGLALPFLFHGNGYLREAALQRLADTNEPSAFALAAIFYRLNDWVAPVRTAASMAVRRAVLSAHPDTAARAVVWLAGNSAEWGRWDGNEIVGEALSAPGVAPAVASNIRFAEKGPWGRSLRVLMTYPGLDRELPTIFRDARISHVRAIAAEALVTGRARWPVGFRREWVDKTMGRHRMVRTFAERRLTVTPASGDIALLAARDRAANVRKVAADALIAGAITGGSAQAIIDTLRDDPNPGIRERIAFVLRPKP